MKAYAQLDEDGRILCTTTEEYADDDMVEVELPEDFDTDAQSEYRIVDGELVHEPLPEPAEVTIARLKANLAETDYVVIKMAEAATSGYSLLSEDTERYAAIIEQRRAWRDEINLLEGGGE